MGNTKILYPLNMEMMIKRILLLKNVNKINKLAFVLSSKESLLTHYFS